MTADDASETSLPSEYDSDEIEAKWRERWKDMDIYAYEPNADAETYAIDTPPPYVSGDLHVGHAMSYTQAEFIARFKRMQGYNVFYPMGFDDNGLPTERYVERTLDIDKHDLGRSEFVEKCKEVTAEGRQNYREIWDLLGISVDWNLLYTTISDESQRVSQLSFLDLYEKDRMYRKEDPVIWCPECRTGLAQADLEDEEEDSHLNHITFPYADRDEGIRISTTRPELIPACVAVFVHPEDERYEDLVGEEVEVPMTDNTVEIYADHNVDMEFGSGAVMVCTFGDKQDIEWWKDHDLEMHIIIDEDGTLNEEAGDYAGMTTEEAREQIVADLDEAGLLEGREELSHAVQVHERCDNPVEYYLADQWFVSMLDIKDELKDRAGGIEWFPDHMQARFDDWTDGLKWDWCVSRQRFYGVPFPVWYCADCGEMVTADEDRLPVDPSEDDPEQACPECGCEEFEPETDVMDTWFTSSLSPLINARWGADEDLMEDIYPMDLRPQGYDIIRTWAFYTILKSHLHTDSEPWSDIMISGMGMAEEGKSFSKSKGIVVKPRKIVDKYSADALRWWSSKVKLGEDLVFREDDLVAGEKLVTKLWNVARFLGKFIDEEPEEPDELEPMDKWLLQRMDESVEQATEWFEVYEYDRSKELVKQFFWHDIADNYLEITKQRLYEGDGSVYVLYQSVLKTLKMLAPILPFVTEEIYEHLYKDHEGAESIHVADWPETEGHAFDEAVERGDMAIEIIGALRKYKSDNNMPLNEDLEEVTVFGAADLEEFARPVKDAMHVAELRFQEESPDLEERIDAIDLAYSEIGPKYGNKVGAIEQAVADPSEVTIEDGRLSLEIDGEEIVLEAGKDFEVSRSYGLKDADGDLVQTENVAVLVHE
jgi:valyl-tRNA synthetase